MLIDKHKHSNCKETKVFHISTINFHSQQDSTLQKLHPHMTVNEYLTHNKEANLIGKRPMYTPNIMHNHEHNGTLILVYHYCDTLVPIYLA